MQHSWLNVTNKVEDNIVKDVGKYFQRCMYRPETRNKQAVGIQSKYGQIIILYAYIKLEQAYSSKNKALPPLLGRESRHNQL